LSFPLQEFLAGALSDESKRRLARIETLFGEPKVKSLPSSAA
jgi:hypothetical protein